MLNDDTVCLVYFYIIAFKLYIFTNQKEILPANEELQICILPLIMP